MHPWFEDREGAPDVLLAAVDPSLAEHLAAVWEGPFEAAGGDEATVFHLHHLTPQHDHGGPPARPRSQWSPTCTAPS